MKRALIVYGGWAGHQPKAISEILAAQLRRHDVEITLSDSLDAFRDLPLTDFDLIIPNWTNGTITPEQLKPVLAAVEGGVGIAGIHGGLCSSFRTETEWHWMAGGQWVAHPGGDAVHYTVHIDGAPSPITEGISDFEVTTEQYYMHVDPANTVLATTRFGSTVMPVAWTKWWGKGRVFYSSLGHRPDVVEMPLVLTMATRGMLWAAR